MIMIVKACIFSPSLTRQLHYHSQLDKSVAWFWKSNEDNLLWILWMRSQFTWKWPPTLIEVVRFTYFAAQNVLLYFAAIQWETSPLNVSFSVWSGDPPGASNEQFQTNKLGSQVAWQVSGGGRGGKKNDSSLCWFELPVSQSWRLDPAQQPDSSDVQSPPHESDFTACQRTSSPNFFFLLNLLRTQLS